MGKVASVGAYVVPILRKELCGSRNVEVMYNTTANKILMKDGTGGWH
jgi:fumarate reductase flavoprotein subunit